MISDSFRDLLKRQKYEEYVFLIICQSKTVFSDISFDKVTSQSNGECDYIDSNGKKYDAKLLIDKKQGELLGNKRIEFEKWIDDLQKEEAEFYQIALEDNLDHITEVRLYHIMKSRLTALEADENAIFFLPFPMFAEFEDSCTTLATTDYIDYVYKQLEEEKEIAAREIYFIYPSLDGKWVLRNADGIREYFTVPELDSFIVIRSYI